MLQLSSETSRPSATSSLDRFTPEERTAHWVSFCVALDYRLDPADLIGSARGKPRLAFARQIAMYLCNVEFSLSYECIGNVFGRDRSTVAHACRVVEDEREDGWLDCRVAALEVICRSSIELVHRPELLLGEDAR